MSEAAVRSEPEPGAITVVAVGTGPDGATPWHTVGVDEAYECLASGPTGLSASEARVRLVAYGRNELEDRGSKGPLRLLWEQLTAVMVLILIGAAGMSLVLGKLFEAGAIGTIVVLFVLLGFVQEYRAERAIAALRRMAVPRVRVCPRWRGR